MVKMSNKNISAFDVTGGFNEMSKEASRKMSIIERVEFGQVPMPTLDRKKTSIKR